MSWSRLKTKIEANFAPSVRGRVSVFMTSYRGAHDREGRGALRVDGREVFNACTTTYWHQEYLLAQEVQAIDGCTDRSDPRFVSAYEAARDLLERKSVFMREEFHDVLRDYLSLSIDDALASTHPVTRALAVLDRRTGKRRLRDFPFMADEHPVVRMLHQVRCEAEGIGSPTPARCVACGEAISTRSGS